MEVYVWGTGRLTGKVIGSVFSPEKVTAYVDNDKSKSTWQGKEVISPAQLLERHYDAILVITLHSWEIYEQCNKLGLNLDKVLFLYQNIHGVDLNTNYSLLISLMGEKYAEIVKNRYHIIRDVVSRFDVRGEDKGLRGGYTSTDYVRIKCFELVAREIVRRKIPGAVAEAGVFRGEFAQHINAIFPDRTLYLCDSFEGFQGEEAANEIKKGNATKAFVDAYNDTSIDIVMQKMKHSDKVVIRKGFFPKTMYDIDEKFAFVSLDMDFEESIYDGLKYFYPLLSSGGYIFIHDYNSSLYGVGEAVDKYEADCGTILPKVPLCDANGTLVLTK